MESTDKSSGTVRALGILSLVLALPFLLTVTTRLVVYLGTIVAEYLDGFTWVFGALLPIGLLCGILGMTLAVRQKRPGIRYAIAGTLACAIPLLVLLVLGYIQLFGKDTP